MILSDRDIKRALASGRIHIDPADGFEDRLGPDALDFRLGTSFLLFERSKQPYIDARRAETAEGIARTVELGDGEPFIIHPQELVLATTLERLQLADDIAARLEGRSSLGRLGIIVHSTASLFHAGWNGHATMELGNLGVMPVALYPGMRVCAFTFEELSSPAEHPYGSSAGDKYSGQDKASGSRIWDEGRDRGS
ncbi:MAG TPA: dCTP deaminase [Dehalococcoidia bacterium]|nr:dCTP deaminase [Dehalococcoidia bacterium]